MFKSACNIPSASLPADLASTVNALFPEGGNPDPSMIRSDVFIYVTQDSTNVSVTFVSSGAGNVNRMGYALYNAATQAVSSGYTVFERINTNSGSRCLTIGDTFKFGTFSNGDQVVFYLDPNRVSSSRFWSYLEAPTLTNPDKTVCDATLGCVHSAWAYLPEQDITIFGFEDLMLGDADYNDLMFFLQIEGAAEYNEVPTYEDGTLKVCNAESGASSSSIATVNCTQWALLESTSSTQSCLTYMPIPTGWTWAPDDATSRAAIVSLASAWSYSSASCFLLSYNSTYGVGYTSNGAACAASEYTITTIVNGTTYCYNAGCTSRFVLKGLDLGTSCTASNRCSTSSLGSVLAYEPTSLTGATIFPTAYSVYLKTSTGSVDLTTALYLPGGYSTTQLVDIIVLADFSTVPSSKVSTVQSSWSNMMSGFTSEKLNARVAFVQYVPSGSSYTLTTDSTFRTTLQTLSSSIFPSSAASCTSSGSRPMYTAIAEVMNNAAWDFRDGAFKMIWVHSACAFDVTTALRTASRATGIVPIFAYAGSGSSNSLPSPGWEDLATAYAPPMMASYKSGTTWASPFTYTTSTNSYPRGPGIMRQFPTSFLAVAVSGDTSFVSGLPTSINTDSQSSGSATISYQLAWPSSGYTYDASATYSTTVRVMGRGTVTYAINFNRKPVLPDVSYSFVGNVNQTIALTPTDADGNTLNVVVKTYPTKGTLYSADGTSKLTASNTLAAGVYNLLYVPNSYVSGTDSSVFTVSDGCETDDGTASLAVTYANNPPVAQNIAFTMYEDSTDTDSNGLINFADYISDVDITNGQSQTLTVQLLSLPSPTSRGSLVTESTRVAVAVGNVATKLRYLLTQPRSGYGTVTFSYRVSDGTSQGNSQSNIATVTITIVHVNHAPVLAITNTHLYAKSSTPVNTLLDGSITDIDYSVDTVNLYVVSSTLASFRLAAGAALNQYDPGDAVPFQLYLTNLTSTSSSFSLSNLVWPATSDVSIETVTLKAQDSVGAWSNEVIVTLETIASNPPVWTDRPANSTNSYASLTMIQGGSISGMRFAAKDEDGSPQWENLLFSVTTFPSHGTISIQALSSSALTTTNAYAFTSVKNATLVGQDTTNEQSYYYVTYKPVDSYYGTDTFTFNVVDTENYSAAEPATVNIIIQRENTAPVSSDISISTLEQVTGTGQIPLSSTNGDNVPVKLRLESINFQGTLKLATGETWDIGGETTETTDAYVEVLATGAFGYYSDSGVPTGNFTYTVHEESTGLSGAVTYTAQVYITHVNHAPESDNRADTIKRRELLKVTLTARDSDADDVTSTLTAKFTSIASSSKGEFFFDSDATDVLDAETLGTRNLDSRTFYYRSMDAYSTNNQALATYTFVVADKQGLQSVKTYTGTITVTPAGDLPVPGSLDTYTYQETPVPMVLATGVTTETGSSPVVKITSIPEKGTFSTCDDSGVCTVQKTAPVTLTSTTGRVIFVPRDYDWGMNFTSFTFSLTDPGSSAVGEFTMRIHVYHVNKRPEIASENFLTTSESNSGIIINESSWHSFDWKVWDVDSLPGTLTTSLRVSFYTTQGFSLYSCTGAADAWGSATCTFNADSDVAFAVRSDFLKNARQVISAFETVTTDCVDADALKALYGNVSDDCEAHFKFAFVPTPLAYYTPYVTISFTAIDDSEGESSTISALIYVKAINTPPTIWAPANVLGTSGVTNPFIRDTDEDSTTYNNPVLVGDVDSNSNIELLTITVTDGSGTLVVPDAASCTADSSGSIWYCLDRIVTFNQWLSDIRFQVTDGLSSVTLKFEINDLGFTSDYKPSTNETAVAYTTITLTDAITAPTGNSSTLAIAVGVAAAAGLLALGALGFFLRKAVSPPTDDYFASATTPLSAAPQSPLYQAQNITHDNALYKARS